MKKLLNKNYLLLCFLFVCAVGHGLPTQNISKNKNDSKALLKFKAQDRYVSVYVKIINVSGRILNYPLNTPSVEPEVINNRGTSGAYGAGVALVSSEPSTHSMQRSMQLINFPEEFPQFTGNLQMTLQLANSTVIANNINFIAIGDGASTFNRHFSLRSTSTDYNSQQQQLTITLELRPSLGYICTDCIFNWS